jgi:hypothetical protein
MLLSVQTLLYTDMSHCSHGEQKCTLAKYNGPNISLYVTQNSNFFLMLAYIYLLHGRLSNKTFYGNCSITHVTTTFNHSFEYKPAIKDHIVALI